MSRSSRPVNTACIRGTGPSPTRRRPPGRRQLFTMPLRGGYPTQLTASEEPVGDPQWSPDGRRLAFVRDDEIWVIEADGSRLVKVTGHKAGTHAPRWSPDGKRLAFVSRRRGWSQVWVIDAPVPRRGRPANEPRAPEEPRPHPGRRRRHDPWPGLPMARRLPLRPSARLDDLETGRSCWSTWRPAPSERSPARPASTRSRAGCSTGRSCSCPTPTAGPTLCG